MEMWNGLTKRDLHALQNGSFFGKSDVSHGGSFGNNILTLHIYERLLVLTSGRFKTDFDLSRHRRLLLLNIKNLSHKQYRKIDNSKGLLKTW